MPDVPDYSPDPAKIEPLDDFAFDFLRGEVKRLAEALAASEASRGRLAAVVRAADAWRDAMDAVSACVNRDEDDDLPLHSMAADRTLERMNEARAALLPADLESHGTPSARDNAACVAQTEHEHG